jgi:hypothetical protein
MKLNNYFFIKILLVAFFIFMLNSWLTYHISESIIKTYFVNGILAFFAILNLLVKYYKKNAEDEIKELYSSWLNGILSFQVIVGLYVLFFIAGCFISSIQLSSDKIQQDTPLSIMIPGKSDSSKIDMVLTPKNPVLKKVVFTIPFGRDFVLNTKGYLKYKFQVYPWTGKRITLENDLRVSPTIIVRVMGSEINQLLNARLIVQINNQDTLFYRMSSHAVILIGQISEIPDEFSKRWFNELKGTFEKDFTVYTYLNKWCTNDPLFIKQNILPNDTLRIILTTDEWIPLASCEGIVDTDKFKEFRFKTLQQ